LEYWKKDCGRYPTAEEFDHGTMAGGSPRYCGGMMPTVSSLFIDGWNRQMVYRYFPDTDTYEFFSYGADGIESGDDVKSK
jgi:hypothetical protein